MKTKTWTASKHYSKGQKVLLNGKPMVILGTGKAGHPNARILRSKRSGKS